MGWTSYNARRLKPNGAVDVKAEMDAFYSGKSPKYDFEILKSTVRGTVYYAAVQKTDRETGEKEVFAGIACTSTSMADGMNFAYKDMDETEGPYYYDCPESILKLLTPTESKYANEWRNTCRKKAEKKKVLKNLPVGAKIRFVLPDGSEIELEKHPAAYQFKTPFWFCEKNCSYMKSTRIPDDFQVVKE